MTSPKGGTPMKTPKRPVALMALAQVICALAVPLTLCVPLMNITPLISYIQMGQYFSDISRICFEAGTFLAQWTEFFV